ncbi:Tim44/TimA family putative adaptor protein [Roseococcus pinisoli]|uniref:Tim44 domain-containing protein n=1 Tax=Roseococcus pinisoli TaxID=2835040 RepID=A0ABS5Q8Y0_9PROT|nr:Tim44/TimA family putative adaptor protein [Roseococcus pinisoli]MBS7810165.1 Tim44 domain-containing protein [Roseococcus pinisoli]
MQGGFPIDLILFAMVAAFLVLRLRSVLGKRQGYERPPAAPGVPEARSTRVENVNDDIVPLPRTDGARRVVPPTSSAAGQNLSRIAAADPAFNAEAFLDGAEGAFRMVVSAFAQGDRQTLRSLLSDDTYAGFEQAVTARENAGEQQRTEIRAMQEIGVEDAALNGNVAEVTVRFVSDQVNITTRNQEIVAGADAVTEVVDIWTFQRDVSQKDPTWRLTATRSA